MNELDAKTVAIGELPVMDINEMKAEFGSLAALQAHYDKGKSLIAEGHEKGFMSPVVEAVMVKRLKAVQAVLDEWAAELN